MGQQFYLPSLNLKYGDNKITVKALANGFRPSKDSNTVSYTGKLYAFYMNDYAYQRDAEMTWQEWVASEYNVEGFFIDANMVFDTNDRVIIYSECMPVESSALIKDKTYYTENPKYFFVLFEGDTSDTAFRYVDRMVWGAWVETHFNNGVFHIEGNMIKDAEGRYLCFRVFNSGEEVYYPILDNDFVQPKTYYLEENIDGKNN